VWMMCDECEGSVTLVQQGRDMSAHARGTSGDCDMSYMCYVLHSSDVHNATSSVSRVCWMLALLRQPRQPRAWGTVPYLQTGVHKVHKCCTEWTTKTWWRLPRNDEQHSHWVQLGMWGRTTRHLPGVLMCVKAAGRGWDMSRVQAALHLRFFMEGQSKRDMCINRNATPPGIATLH
jgi:hypothetical protein